jgi:hypothetical protein
MASHALAMESLSYVYSSFSVMARSTPNIRISLLQFALIQYVLTVAELVMAVCTREIPGHMDLMGEHDRRSLLFFIDLRVVEYDLLWLRTESGYHRGHKNGP